MRHPKDWYTDVIVVRSGGRDPKGNPLPAQELPVTDCLLAPRATSDPVDRSDVVDSNAVLYRESNDFTFQSTDRIRVPDGARLAGEWSIDGSPNEWPKGVEVGLRR